MEWSVTEMLDIHLIHKGVNAEEKFPEGTISRRCDRCGAIGDFDLRLLRPTPVRFLIPRVL